MSERDRELLAVEGELSTERINACFLRLRKNPDCDLVLPTRPTIRSPLALPQVLQLIATWNRWSASQAVIRTYLGSDTEHVSFRDYFHGLVAGLLSRRILDRTGIEISDKVRRLCTDKLAEHFTMARKLAPILNLPAGIEDKRVLPLPSRGPSTLFLCADGDHETDEMPFVYGLEGGKAMVRPAYQFVRLLLRTFSHGRIGADLQRAAELDESLCENLGVVCQELFKNTDGWARHGVDGAMVPNGIRGVLVEVLGGITELQKLMPKAPQSDPLLQYLERRLTGQRHAAVSVSVFDSGPGLARRWLKCPTLEGFSLAQEYEAVTQCLSLHATTSDVLGRGVGLHQVLMSLSDSSVRGFLFLRTGRLCLYRDLETNPIPKADTLRASEYWLDDWTSRAMNAPCDAGWAEGTLVTFVFLVPISP